MSRTWYAPTHMGRTWYTHPPQFSLRSRGDDDVANISIPWLQPQAEMYRRDVYATTYAMLIASADTTQC